MAVVGFGMSRIHVDGVGHKGFVFLFFGQVSRKGGLVNYISIKEKVPLFPRCKI